MNLSQRKEAFIALGQYLRHLSADTLEEWYVRTRAENTWFTPENIQLALNGVINYLDSEALTAWTDKYQLDNLQSKIVGVVMAGNIPLVGFHDFLAVLMAGHTIQAKLSSQDSFLLKKLIEALINIAPQFAEKIQIVQQLKGFEAIIATGSNNTSRYFEYYFGKYPHFIRKNRNSVAVLTGKETVEEMAALGSDILQYYGLGCRNVSKVYVPEGYSFTPLFDAMTAWSKVIDNHRYQNNYDYNKSIYLVNRVPHLDTGYLLATPDTRIASPISVLYTEEYQDLATLTTQLQAQEEQIQCIVAKSLPQLRTVGFGQAQAPQLTDYADGVDTMLFLQNLG